MNLQVSINDEQQRKLADTAAAKMTESGNPCTLQDVVRDLIDGLPKTTAPAIQQKKQKGAR